jgi:hypothetical protein
MRARALARGDVNEARRARVPLVPLSRLKYFHALASEVETPNAPGAKPRTEFRRPGGTSGTCVQIVDRVVLILSFRAEREICFPLAPANSRFFVAPLLRMTKGLTLFGGDAIDSRPSPPGRPFDIELSPHLSTIKRDLATRSPYSAQVRLPLAPLDGDRLRLALRCAGTSCDFHQSGGFL